MLMETLPRLPFGSHFDQPDCSFDSLDLAEKGPDPLKGVVSPVLEKPRCLRGHQPVIRTGQPTPLIDLAAQIIDDGDRFVPLLSRRKPGAVVKLKVLLNERLFALPWLRDRGNELCCAPVIDDLLRRLTALVHLPVPGRILVGRIENRMLKKAVFHR